MMISSSTCKAASASGHRWRRSRIVIVFMIGGITCCENRNLSKRDLQIAIVKNQDARQFPNGSGKIRKRSWKVVDQFLRRAGISRGRLKHELACVPLKPVFSYATFAARHKAKIL